MLRIWTFWTFNSPDSWSPFGERGLNAYAYCQGDPINFRDPSGHILTAPMKASLLKDVLKGISQRSKSISKPLAVSGKRVNQLPKASTSGGASGMTLSDETAVGPALNRSKGRDDAKTLLTPSSELKKTSQLLKLQGHTRLASKFQIYPQAAIFSVIQHHNTHLPLYPTHLTFSSPI